MLSTFVARFANATNVPGYTSQLLALPSRKQPQDAAAKVAAPTEPFPDTVTVLPFKAKALDDSLAAREMPVYRLSEIEAAARNSADAAVHVQLAFSSQAAIRAGQCVLLRLQYSTGDGEVRLHGMPR